MAARGGMAGLRKTVARKALGAAYEATGASRNPLISKAVEAAGRGYEAYKEHKESNKPQEHRHTFEPDPREQREAENARRQEEAHQEGIQAETDKKFDESTAVLEVMANDISDIKSVIVGDSKSEDSFLGKMIKGFIGVVTLRLTSFLKPFRAIMSKVGRIIEGVTGFLKTVISALANSSIGKALGLGALAMALGGEASAGESDIGPDKPAADFSNVESAVSNIKPVEPTQRSLVRQAAPLLSGVPGMAYMLGRGLVDRVRRKDSEAIEPEPPVASGAPSPITPAGGNLSALSNSLRGAKARERERILIEEAQRAGITDPREMAALLAQTRLESGNYNYSEEIWGNTRAQRGYEGRADLGNTQPGDGYRFRGRGFIQLTGRANYEDFAKASGLDVVNNPDMIANDPRISAQATLHYWKTRVRSRVNGDWDNVDKISALINGRNRSTGQANHIDERRSNYRTLQADVARIQAEAAPQGPVLANAEAKEKAADRQANATAFMPIIAPPAQQAAIPSGSKGAAGPQTPMITHSPDGIVRAIQLSYVAHSA